MVDRLDAFHWGDGSRWVKPRNTRFFIRHRIPGPFSHHWGVSLQTGLGWLIGYATYVNSPKAAVGNEVNALC